jgi:hypothetical protein
MTFRDPTWLQFVIVVLGAWRVTRLVNVDDITLGLRTRVTGLTDSEYNRWAKWIWELQQAREERGGDPIDPWSDPPPWDGPPVPVGRFRFKVAQLVRCPWCAGFWISVLVWLAWWAEPRGTLAVAVPLATSAIAGLVAKHLD